MFSLFQKKFYKSINTFTIISIIGMNQSAFAWKNHTLITEYSLKDTHIYDDKNMVKVETLEDFLSQTSNLIPNLLTDVENWTIGRTHIYPFTYPETPKEFKFNALPNDPNIVEKFLQAIRVNPTVKIPLFLQILPGDIVKNPDDLLKMDDVIIPSILADIGDYTFIKVSKGDYLNPLKVLASASDEPDYGFDINLFDDNPKNYKENYQFGNQPFGNANFSFSSQAPFHMGFYHQSSLVYNLAPYIKKTYAEYRIKLFQELSIMAFKKGHPYWGYRFLGWSLHYAQDLTQPFHNAPIPGYSTTDLIGLDILDKLEGTFCKTHTKMFDAINVITNRHLILEKLIYDELLLAKKNNLLHSPIIISLQNISNDNNYGQVDDNYIRNTISQEAAYESKPTYGSYIFWKINKDISSIIGRSFPYKYTFDPKYIYNNSFDAINILDQEPESAQIKMQEAANRLMSHAGSHTRKMVQYVMQMSNNPNSF